MNILDFLNQYIGVVQVIGVIAFGGWAYALIWASKEIKHALLDLGKKVEAATHAINYTSQRVTKIEGWVEGQDEKFKPYRNGGRV